MIHGLGQTHQGCAGVAASTPEGGPSGGWAWLRRQNPGVGSHPGSPGLAARVSGVPLVLRAGPMVPPTKGGAVGKGWKGWRSRNGRHSHCVGCVPACFSPCGRLFCKVRAARRGVGVGLRLWACGQRRLRLSGGVGRVSGPLARDLGPGQVHVSGPRCRKTDVRPLGSGPRCQGRAWPWLEKAHPHPRTAGAAKVEACAGRQPGAWALRAAAAALWTGRGQGRRERGPAGLGVWPGLRGCRAGQRTRRWPVGPAAGWSAAVGQSAGGVGNAAPPGVRGAAAAKGKGGKSLQHPVFPGGLPSKY